MSKFLKFIVNVFLIFAILVAAAILIPPLAGVTTTIVDTASMDTNLPLGSITYSTDVAVSELKTGDEVLKENNSSTYSYIIKSGDASTGTFTVVSSTNPDGEEEEITLKNTVSKVAVMVPYIGYVIIAMHSTEGVIIIALVVVLMIILFILSELWKAKSDDDDDEEEEDGNEENAGDEAQSGEAAAEETDAAADGESMMPAQEVTFADDIPEINPDITLDEDADMRIAADETADINDIRIPDLDFSEESTEPDDAEAAEDVPSNIEETENEAAEEFDDAVVSEEEPAEETDAPENEEVEETETPEEPAVPEIGEIDSTPADGSEAEGEHEAEAEIEEPAQVPDEAVPEEPVTVEAPEEAEDEDAEFDFADAIFAATEEVEAEEEKRAAAAEEAAGRTQVILTPQFDEPEETEADSDEQPERFVPVDRPTLEELMDQAKKAGDEPNIRKNDATDITIVDYSDIL